jgi:hypothetical protein
MSYLVRIEGADFATTLYDTDDLSTIRGASQAYIYLPARIAALFRARTGWQVDAVLPGAASIGIFRAEAPGGVGEAAVENAVADAIAAPVGDAADRLDKVRPHLSFTWAAVKESGDYGADSYRLAARAKARQLCRLSVDVPRAEATLPCQFDRRRPAVNSVTVGGASRRASASVKARHDYGRIERHRFYESELDWSGLDKATFAVTQSLQDLVDPLRSELDDTDRVRMPLALASKIAIVYLDGNKFTAIREATVFGDGVEDKEGRHRSFDKFVREERRRDLLSRIVKRLSRDGRHNWVYRDGCWRLRFETLLWGGDEALFVLPAWALMDALPELMAALDGWTWEDGYTLSHAVGIAICNVKTPIAVARKLAEDIADAAKDKDVIGEDRRNLANAVSIQVFESVEPPRTDLSDFRAAFYGTGAARAFTLKGRAEVEDMLRIIRSFQREKDGLPRSQLYRLIAEMRTIVEGPDHAETKTRKLAAYAPPNGAALVEAFERSGCTIPVATLMSAALGYTPAAPRLPFIRLAELWDYVDPFGTAG